MTRPDAHLPVLCAEVVAALAPASGDVFIDGTFGRGGYTMALLAAADCRVLGIDRDPTAGAAADRVLAAHPERFLFVKGRFGELDRLAADHGVRTADGVTLDIGVSSPQLDDPARGFSFRTDGPLDMRMGPDGPTAADVVNTAGEAELADIFFRLGEERFARRIARRIVARRADRPYTRTLDLADTIRAAVPMGKDRIDPATRAFQGLRIHVNDELGELSRGLDAAERVLKPGGRLAVVSFHSLEDRRVKRFLTERSSAGDGGSRHRPAADRARRAPTFQLSHRKPIIAGQVEVSANPRARSAKLRAAVRTEAPAWTSREVVA